MCHDFIERLAVLNFSKSPVRLGYLIDYKIDTFKIDTQRTVFEDDRGHWGTQCYALNKSEAQRSLTVKDIFLTPNFMFSDNKSRRP